MTLLDTATVTRCAWGGVHSGMATVQVIIVWPCGHFSGGPVYTCNAHLDELHSVGGQAPKASPCPVCQEEGYARVGQVIDLD